MSLDREFLHSLVELVLFELILGITDVLLSYDIRVGGLREFARLIDQSDSGMYLLASIVLSSAAGTGQRHTTAASETQKP